MTHLLHKNRFLLMLLLGIITLGFSSCTKYSFMSMEDKIVGVWRFDDVSFTKGFSLSRRDASNDYRHWEYEFTQDGRFFMNNTTTRESFEGKWYMTSTSDYDYTTESTTVEFDLHVSVYNPDTREIEQFIWNVTNITSKRMNAIEYFSNETWYYRLNRL